MSIAKDYANGIYAIDSGYVAEEFDAIHLVVEKGRVAIIDTGVNDSVPAVLAALSELGLSPDNVLYIVLTHIHLDHAGGAGLLMQHCPNAQLVVHPRGVVHMADPGKLIAGTEAVYGKEKFARLYGDIIPIDAERIVESQHGQTLDLYGRELILLHTPGHALHHICIVDLQTKGIFTGDTFGLSYRHLDNNGQQFILATTTPVHFDPRAMIESIDLLMSFEPQAMYLTHYSQVTDVNRLAEDLKVSLEAHVSIAKAAPGEGDDRIAAIKGDLADYLQATAREQDWGLQGSELLDLLAMDIDLNAQGLEVWLKRLQKTA